MIVFNLIMNLIMNLRMNLMMNLTINLLRINIVFFLNYMGFIWYNHMRFYHTKIDRGKSLLHCIIRIIKKFK